MEREDCTKFDFLCEKRLNQTDKLLYQYFRNSIFALECLLSDYKNVFPFFTDHTFEHSEQVIRYCNIIAGEEIISALFSRFRHRNIFLPSARWRTATARLIF